MQALLVVDAQNEFSPEGQRAVVGYDSAIAAIHAHVDAARAQGRPIAWIRHHNRPDESPEFVPGTWGAELAAGLGPRTGFGPETLFEKDVFGAFTTTPLQGWLESVGADSLLIVGFFAHMCVSTSAREALVRGWDVSLDPAATGARDLKDEQLGRLSAAEVVRTAFLQLLNMGAVIQPRATATIEVPA
jgi:nicotinamidase-related amidase